MATHRLTSQSSSKKAADPSTSLPYAIDATMSLSAQELSVLQDQYEEEQDKGFVSTQTKFNLAWCARIHLRI
jgi:hypothetical protein